MRVGTSIELVACHESFANINQFAYIYINVAYMFGKRVAASES